MWWKEVFEHLHYPFLEYDNIFEESQITQNQDSVGPNEQHILLAFRKIMLSCEVAKKLINDGCEGFFELKLDIQMQGRCKISCHQHNHNRVDQVSLAKA